MKLIQIWMIKFAAKCPPGKRGRPMSKSPEAAEAAGFEVCEKETRDGRTVAYKTGRQLEKEKEAKSEKQMLRKEAGISAKGRISKANLAKLNELKAKLDSLKAIQIEQENVLESKIEEGNVKPEDKKDEPKTKTDEPKFSQEPKLTEGLRSQEFKNQGDLKAYRIIKDIVINGKKSKPYIADIALDKNGKIDRDFYDYGSDQIDISTDQAYRSGGYFYIEKYNLLSKLPGYSRIVEYRNANESFKRYLVYNNDKNAVEEYTDDDFDKVKEYLSQKDNFLKKADNIILEKYKSDGQELKENIQYETEEENLPYYPGEFVGGDNVWGRDIKDGDKIIFSPLKGVRMRGVVKNGKVYAKEYVR